MSNTDSREAFEVWYVSEGCPDGPAHKIAHLAWQASASAHEEKIKRLREALEAFMALDRSFATICDEHLSEIAKNNPMGRAVQLARAALESTK